MKRGFVVLLILAAIVSRNGAACSPDYYEQGLLEMPTAMFNVEVPRILGLPPAPTDDLFGPQGPSDPRVADYADLAEALQARPDAEELIEGYRKAATDALAPGPVVYDEQAMRFRRTDPVDLAPYDELLARLPQEFALYFRGAAAYRHDAQAAIPHFAAILDLPAEQRRFRSTWAAYMLGQCYRTTDPAQAETYYQQARDLAAEGYKDTLGLAAASAGWQAQAAFLAGRYLDAIHLYAADPQHAAASLRFVCRKALGTDTVDPALVQDGLARRILTAWLVAFPDEDAPASRWLAALETLQPEGRIAGADYLAWFSYNRGRMDDASRWLAQADPASPYAQWVQAKLLLREGKLEEGAAQLTRLAKSFTEGREPVVEDPHQEFYGERSAGDLVREDIGEIRLEQGDYAGALQAFLEAHDWEDVATTAERILTTDELRAFVDTHAKELPQGGTSGDVGYFTGQEYLALNLSHLLARRLAREGRWDEAIPYYPEALTHPWSQDSQPARARAIEVKAHLDAAGDRSLPASKRAEHLFAAGSAIRADGPLLICPDLVPQVDMVSAPAVADPNSELARRMAASQKPYPRMNYFQWIAADYMWRAAELLPDNDPHCAHALYLGGIYVKNRDVGLADRFYKALVRRNPNLLIAQWANERRWFPEEFTDVVLYHSPPPGPWYGRKLYLAVAGLAALPPVLFVAVVLLLRRRKPATAGGTPGVDNQG